MGKSESLFRSFAHKKVIQSKKQRANFQLSFFTIYPNNTGTKQECDTFGDIFNWQETTMGWTWSFFGNCTPTPSCDDKSLSYGEAPGIACSAGASFYSFDSTNNLLYNFGSCGGDYAPEGFYVDGTMIYWWHMDRRVWVWEAIGPCG